MNYKDILKKLRIENNLSQEEVANNIEIARQTCNHYEVGENIIPLKHLNFLANFYNVLLDYLFTLTKEKNYLNFKKEIDTKISGERLKAFRKENNLTQEKLAKVLNTFHTVIVDFEHAKNLIATPFLYDLCKKYKISADYLLGRTNEPKILV